MHCESMVRWLDLVPPPTGILTLRQLANPAGFLVLPANKGFHRTGGRRLFSWLKASARPIAAPGATDILHVSLPPAGDSRRSPSLAVAVPQCPCSSHLGLRRVQRTPPVRSMPRSTTRVAGCSGHGTLAIQMANQWMEATMYSALCGIVLPPAFAEQSTPSLLSSSRLILSVRPVSYRPPEKEHALVFEAII